MKILKNTEFNRLELQKRFNNVTKTNFNIVEIIREIGENDLLLNRGEYEIRAHESINGHTCHVYFEDLLEDFKIPS